MLYSLLDEQEIVWNETTPFVEIFYENCFKITLTVSKNEESTSRIKLVVGPEDENGYELLVSFLVRVNGIEHWVDNDLWRTEQDAFEQVVDGDKLKLEFSLNMHDVLSPKNIHIGGGFRNFRVLSSNNEYFVNASALNEFGGSLFQDWYRRECTGESTIAATELDNDELENLLTACCAYSTVIVTRQNVDILIRVAWKYKITGVLRAIEQYLLNSKGIHIISKLDYSYNYKFAMLGTYALKSAGNKYQRKEILLDYLKKKNIPYCPHYLMEMLDLQNLS